MNGHKVSENCYADLYTVMVPIEETQLSQEAGEDGLDKDLVKINYVLKERDYFNSQDYNSLDHSANPKPKSLLTFEAPSSVQDPGDDQENRISISCHECVNFRDGLDTIWYRCDSKSDNVNF